MIQLLNSKDLALAKSILELSKESYAVEAEIIGVADFPPLRETIEEVAASNNRFLGYFDGPNLLGVLEYSNTGNESWIHRLAVKPSHFKNGVASSLLLSALSESSVYFVGTSPLNRPAVKLYEKFGFNYNYEKMVGSNSDIRWTVYKCVVLKST